jgi:hypothetical protein
MVFLVDRQYKGVVQERQGTAARVNVTSPVGGLNTRDAESGMEATDAILMENWFPGQGSVSTRKGFSSYATGLTGNVETLMEFNAGATRKFLCANSDEINDITNPASISNLKTGQSNARWQYINFNGNMLMVNGADTPLTYDGSTISNSTIHGSHLTPSNLNGVNVHKNRVYAWDSNTQDFWYGATNAIGGTFTKFQLSRVAQFGGDLVTMQTWNLDGGDGVDDYALFLMSSGDAILYQGSDPGDATNWSLVGTYKIGAPLAIRGAKKVAGDVFIITDQDVLPFSTIFKGDGAVSAQSKLSGAIIKAANLYSANYGWEVELYPKGGWLLFNVPVATNVTYIQYIINTITGAATKFTGMNARTWGIYNDKLYFGENGEVFLADNGFDDNGNFIQCDVSSAFSNLGSPLQKTINSFRNTVQADGNVVFNTTVSFDYGLLSTTQTTSTTSSGTQWDTAQWDTFQWADENTTKNDLVLSSGSGVDVSMRMKVSLKGQQVFWFRTDYSFSLNNIV